jgi:hypothetical protein
MRIVSTRQCIPAFSCVPNRIFILTHQSSDLFQGQDTTQLRSVLDECLLKKTGGYLWPVIPLQKSAFDEPLKQFKVSDKISTAQITAATDVTVITSPWTTNKAAILVTVLFAVPCEAKPVHAHVA